MKLDVAVNEIVLSNVGTTGEFRIRNSAKAFKILSDGLYSNKIRAIIRELSCNALDSHVAANNPAPFEVHLPTVLEPWFAVKDFGTGLSSEQVTSIYTTYFESTKTDSNDFIGALGLGSKSPFSYTENFTITAIKDGVKCIFSAFINQVGVPSVAEMSKEATNEPNGVEVKFSVTDRYDYSSFRNEAVAVFRWFKSVPTITGTEQLEITPEEFAERDIVPGVHVRKNDSYNHSRSCIAVMGNIAYPLDKLPEPTKYFGDLAELLNCGLVFEFGIGELDFAASREELSYVPLTIDSIGKKLALLNDNLAKHIATQANEITSEWHRAIFLQQKIHENQRLYKAAVHKYVIDTKFGLFDPTAYYGRKTFKLKVNDLKAKGIEISAFRTKNSSSTTKISNDTDWDASGVSYQTISVPVESDVVIVLNDLKTGCQARARYHYVNYNNGNYASVYCVSHESTDLTVRQAAYDALIKDLHNPPVVVKASDLKKSDRKQPTKSSGIAVMNEKKNVSRYGYSRPTGEYSWSSTDETFDDNTTYYYVCLNNHTPVKQDGSEININSIRTLMSQCGIKSINDIKIYGVRKSRLKEIQELDNWVWFEDKLTEEIAKISEQDIIGFAAAEVLDDYNTRVYTNKNVAKKLPVNSPYAEFVKKYASIKSNGDHVSYLVSLCSMYGKTLKATEIKDEIKAALHVVAKKYTLLKHINSGASESEVADYIKLVDKQS